MALSVVVQWYIAELATVNTFNRLMMAVARLRGMRRDSVREYAELTAESHSAMAKQPAVATKSQAPAVHPSAGPVRVRALPRCIDSASPGPEASLHAGRTLQRPGDTPEKRRLTRHRQSAQ